jgi:hypothetical protein
MEVFKENENEFFDSINMIETCTDNYEINTLPDEGIKISIKVPKKFRDLWLIKLTELTTSIEEIQEYSC